MLQAQALPLRPETLPAEWDSSKELERVIHANGETPAERLARLEKAAELERQLEAWRRKVLEMAEAHDLLIPEVAAIMPFTPRIDGPVTSVPIRRCPN